MKQSKNQYQFRQRAKRLPPRNSMYKQTAGDNTIYFKTSPVCMELLFGLLLTIAKVKTYLVVRKTDFRPPG